MYGEDYKFEHFDFEKGREATYHYLTGNFDYHITFIYLYCIELFDAGRLLKLNYKEILQDVIEGFKFNFWPGPDGIAKTGFYFPEMLKNPTKYLIQNNLKEVFDHFKANDLRIFLATNSGFEYATLIIENSLGKELLDYFDLIIYDSKKPSFFQKNKEREFFILDKEKKDYKGERFVSEDIEKDDLFKKIIAGEKYLIEANSCFVESFYKILLNKENIQYCYVGDNFNSDCLQAVKKDNWSTIGVSDSLVTESIRKQHDQFMNLWGDYFHCLDFEGKLRSSYFNKIIRENFSILIPNVLVLKYFTIHKNKQANELCSGLEDIDSKK